jgi:hypothetical protein
MDLRRVDAPEADALVTKLDGIAVNYLRRVGGSD